MEREVEMMDNLNWLMTLFAKSLPIDITTRIWDNYLLNGESFMIRFASPRLLYDRVLAPSPLLFSAPPPPPPPPLPSSTLCFLSSFSSPPLEASLLFLSSSLTALQLIELVCSAALGVLKWLSAQLVDMVRL
eukprot:655478-Hanusia_phi.AAC.1